VQRVRGLRLGSRVLFPRMPEEGESLFVLSESHWNGFDHTLRRHGRNDPRELVVRSVEQGAEFRFGSLSPSGHH